MINILLCRPVLHIPINHIDHCRIRTLDNTLSDRLFVVCWLLFVCFFIHRDYQLGHAPLLESLLGMNVSKCIYKDINIIFITYEHIIRFYIKYEMIKIVS